MDKATSDLIMDFIKNNGSDEVYRDLRINLAIYFVCHGFQASEFTKDIFKKYQTRVYDMDGYCYVGLAEEGDNGKFTGRRILYKLEPSVYLDCMEIYGGAADTAEKLDTFLHNWIMRKIFLGNPETVELPNFKKYSMKKDTAKLQKEMDSCYCNPTLTFIKK